MESEVNRSLADGIIQVSTSPWLAQAFVDRDGPEPRMVIDCSQTINGHTSKDAFLFPNFQILLDQAAENTFFRKSIGGLRIIISHSIACDFFLGSQTR